MQTFFKNSGNPTPYIMDELKEIDENGYIVEIGAEVSPPFDNLLERDRQEIYKKNGGDIRTSTILRIPHHFNTKHLLKKSREE
jgi:hypothetical protein